jgi:hypothetical protein
MGARRPCPGRDARNLACQVSPLPNLRPLRVRSAHEGLALDLDSFLIAPLGAQRIGEQPPRLSLRAVIAACYAKRLARAALRLMRVALKEPQPPKFYPQQGIVRLDAQGAVERRRGAVKIAAGSQGS